MSRVEITQELLRPDARGFLRAVSGEQVTVRVHETGSLAAVYVAETGDPQLANPLTSDSGRLEGWVEAGYAYDLIAAGGETYYFAALDPAFLVPKVGRIEGVILDATPANLVDNANTYVQIAGAEFTATFDGDSPVRVHFEGAIGVNDGTVSKRGTVEIRMGGVTPGILVMTLQNGAAAGTPGGYMNLSRKSAQIVPSAGAHVFTAWWKAFSAPQTLRFFLGIPVLDFYVAHAPDE